MLSGLRCSEGQHSTPKLISCKGKWKKTQQDALGEKYVWPGEEYSGRTECGYEAARGFLIAFVPNMFFSVGICDLKKKKNPLTTKPKTTTSIGTRVRYETQIHILMAAYPQPSVSQQSKNKFTHLCMCSNTEVAEISLQFSRLESLGTPKL